MRPVIGVTGNIMQAPEDKFKSFKINYSPWGYTEAVRLAGGTPVILPLTEPTCACAPSRKRDPRTKARSSSRARSTIA
ncbi:MAG: gamma-glutamyl-gamma-aminobutyrate hydrolase family protein, partial [Abiotrophia defectiva]|nr:gamma-glutamyl-gamma-aminobutyrate hydrolase family protein [Abiotrophia defectiva]